MMKLILAMGLALTMGGVQARAQNSQQPTDRAEVTSIQTDLPLLQARENLMLARESAQIGNFAETHTELQGASQALSNYADHSGRHANDARKLKTQIDGYDQSIQPNRNDAVQTIDRWWDQTAGWDARPQSK